MKGDAPPTVNPSLWRQAQLDNQHGLFEVVPGIWQVRGYDLSNMTLIEGRTGWIVVDPLTVTETAAAALALARKHLGERDRARCGTLGYQDIGAASQKCSHHLRGKARGDQQPM